MIKRKSLITFLTFVLIIFTTFTYSALSTRFQVITDVVFRLDADIRITDILLDSTSNGGLISFDSNYTKNTITSGFKLPNLNSTVSYNVTITNKGNIDQAIYNITTISSSNNNIYYLIDDKPINEALPMIVPLGTSKTIKITYKTTSPFSDTETIVNNFVFKKVYYVDYNLKGGSYTNDQNDLKNGQIKYEDVPLTLTNEKPTKSKYVFMGWTDEQNGTTVKYQSGSTYTLNEDKIMYAVWKTGEATFLPGYTFNTKIKKLAGNSSATYSSGNTNITSIQRANSVPQSWINGSTITPPSDNNIVSTQDSDFPIYAWFDNGIIYYYSEATNIYMNTDAGAMFFGLHNVKSIDLSTIATTKTTSMWALFDGCYELENLDLSHFNTGNVTNMGYMFTLCKKISSLNLSNFNTNNANNMRYMFAYTFALDYLNINNFNTSNVTDFDAMFTSTHLSSIDLSNINMSNANSVKDMLTNISSLNSLKTPNTYPSDTSVTIALPTTLYDASNNSYTTLQTGNPTQTWIKLPYTVKYNSNSGTGTMADQKIGVDATTTLTTNAFTRENYTFVGWNTKADGTGTAYLDEASVSNLGTYNQTINLYAQWAGIPYTVTFNTNGGNINKFEGKELVIYPEGVDSYSVNNNVYTNTTSTAYPSIMLPLDMFTNGKTYTLKYKFKKNSGTLYTLGGHCQSTSKIYLKVDGKTRSGSYNLINMNDDNLVHEIEYKFVFYSGNGGVYIQPNRSYGSLINYDLWDIEVIEDNYVATKTVYYDSTYGTLPTPLKEGYTFKGWNGKNLFDEETILMNIPNATYENGYYNFKNSAAHSIYGGNNSLPINNFKPDTQYTFKINGYMEFSNLSIWVYYTNGDSAMEGNIVSTDNIYVFTTAANKTIDYVQFSFGNVATVHISSFQIEEGNSSTPYEPYYVTSSVNVTQAKNHTLTAIWEVNNYEIVFDKNSNDATGTMSNLSMTYDESKVLTTNAFTRTGYTFVGWNTKADGTGTAYLDGASVSNVASSGTVTLYAQWAVISYTVTLDSNEGNIMDNVALIGYDSTMEKSNNEYIVSGSSATAGLYVPSEAFEGGKTYILRFKIQKVDGRLTALGGHLAHSQIYFKIDGSNSSSRYTDYYSTTNNITNDTNVHTVELKFTYNGSTSGTDRNIYIQPNRAKTDYFKVKIFDVELEELSTTKTVNFSGTYGTLPTPTTPGYQFAGWNGKNLFEVGTLDDYYIYYPSGMNVSISNNKISSTILEGQMAFIRNEKHTYTAGNYVFKYQSSNGNKRHLIYPYDENGNILTDSDISISGWTYNQSYGGWFSNLLDSEYSTAVIPEEVSYWKYGIVFTGAISEFGDTLEVSNIMIEEGVESTPYEPYFVTSSTPLTRNEDHTLYAKWTPNTYSIVFDKNDNAATGTMNNQSMTYGTSSNLTNNSYYKRGYKFVGWNTASDGTGTAYLNGASVSNLTNVNNGTITLYAQWEKLMAEDVGHTIQDLNCEDVQCVIDELYYMLY